MSMTPRRARVARDQWDFKGIGGLPPRRLGELLDLTKERLRHKKPRPPSVAAPDAIIKFSRKAVLGKPLVLRDRDGTISLWPTKDSAVSDHLQRLAVDQTRLWEHLAELCKDGTTLDGIAKQLVVVTIGALVEIKASEAWIRRLGKITAGKAKKWTGDVAVKASEKIASDARRLLSALSIHKDLADTPSTEYWDGRRKARKLDQGTTALLLKAPPLQMLLEELVQAAEDLKNRYATGKKSRPSREGAHATLFLTTVCEYLCQRFPAASTSRLSKIAHGLTVSAFPNEDYEDRAKNHLKKFRGKLKRTTRSR